METVALVVGVLIAVGGWFANGVLARRSVRRQMRIDYLMSAYRQLESASNRAMTVDHESAIERAISEIQLLGTTRHVELADEFARQFASDATADAGPLLEELRATLRKELLLEPLPGRRTWLRISRAGQWAEESARIRARVLTGAQGRDSEPGTTTGSLMELAPSDPTEAVIDAYHKVEIAVQDLVAVSGQQADITGSELTRAALDHGVISRRTAEAIDGLTVMRNLAVHGGHEVDVERAQEFLVLADAVLFAIRMERPVEESPGH
jgi:hypothetical protein